MSAAEALVERIRAGESVIEPLARVPAGVLEALNAEVAAVAAAYPPCVKVAETAGEPYRVHSLYNASGRTDEGDVDPRARLERRFLAPECAALGGLVRAFEPDLQILLVACSPPGSHLRAHHENVLFEPDPLRPRDAFLGRTACLRLHLPIRADPRAYSTIGGRRYRFEEGVLYLYNNTIPHSVDNASDVDRYHLLFDVWLSRRNFAALFADAGGDAPAPFVRLDASERAALREACAAQGD